MNKLIRRNPEKLRAVGSSEFYKVLTFYLHLVITQTICFTMKTILHFHSCWHVMSKPPDDPFKFSTVRQQ